ncbi:MAG: hypothetical protein JW709_06390 [Sedimentisphaerales bacterium]|nr:hypothetical protein [Sedimentisphaerales bacterium]
MSVVVRKNILFGIWGIAIFICVLHQPRQCTGIVMHPESSPIPSAQRPVDGVMGRWGSNASCVAISPNYIITTRHQGGGVGTIVRFNGESFRVAAIMNEPTTDGAADLRVCLITRPDGTPANRSDYAVLYSGDPTGLPIVVGGFGWVRGEAVYNSEIGWGYKWLSASNLNWGANTIDDTQDDVVAAAGSFTSDTALFDFDPYNVILRPFECAVATGDSGGGWFIEDGGEWKLTSLSAYVQFSSASYYDVIGTSYGEWHWGIRLQSYLSWITPLLIEPPCANVSAADITHDCQVTIEDMAVLSRYWLEGCNLSNAFCEGGDVAADGMINLEDFAIMAGDWLNCGYAAPWGCEN